MPTKYGEITTKEFVHLVVNIVFLPIVLLRVFVVTTTKYGGNWNEIKRNSGIRFIRWLTDTFSRAQLQFLVPSTVTTYKIWSKLRGMPVTVENLIDDTTLVWIGPKRTDKVILYVHGGFLLFPVLPNYLELWRYIRLQLAKSDREVGVAMLAYSLYPTAVFPTQLHQTVIAVEHLIATGVHPSNLHLVGSSAGAQIILSFASHVLHPLGIPLNPSTPEPIRKNIRQFKLPAPIRGFYLMSPWVSIVKSRRQTSDPPLELFSTAKMIEYGSTILGYNDQRYAPYFEPANAEEGWFEELGNVVERVLVSAGDRELFREDITRFSKTLGDLSDQEMSKLDFRFVVEEGVHDTPAVDFLVMIPEKGLNRLTKVIVDWLKDGIDQSNLY